MIGKLKGLVDSVDEENLILDVGGVGYLVAASARTLRALPRAGEAVALLIETQVREDAIRLFGFLSVAERDWFRLLQNVQGVGAKVALAHPRRAAARRAQRRDPAPGQGHAVARAGRRPKTRRAAGRGVEGQGAGWGRFRRRPGRRRGGGETAEGGAKRPCSPSSASAISVRRRSPPSRRALRRWGRRRRPLRSSRRA